MEEPPAFPQTRKPLKILRLKITTKGTIVLLTTIQYRVTLYKVQLVLPVFALRKVLAKEDYVTEIKVIKNKKST